MLGDAASFGWEQRSGIHEKKQCRCPARRVRQPHYTKNQRVPFLWLQGPHPVPCTVLLLSPPRTCPPSKCSHCPTSLAPFSFLSPLQESPPFGMHLHPTHFLQHHLSSLEEPITITSSERLFPDHLNQHSLSSALLLNLSQFFSGFLHSMTPPIKEVQRVKNPPAMQETHVQSLAQEDPLEKGMATHSSILAWEIPWTEELGRLQSMGLQRVGHD